MVSCGAVTAIGARLRTGGFLISAVALLVGGLTLVRALTFWPRHTYLDVASGVWTALAFDLANGVFYRPVVSDAGYGGTRYFPVFFTGHAALIKVIGDPFWAGYAMSAAAIVCIVVGVTMILRTVGRLPSPPRRDTCSRLAGAPRALFSIRPDVCDGIASSGWRS
jgi:hypothetical protein